MASTRSWLRLPLPASSDLPVLLVSIHMGTAEYTIHVTDMANMWTESLDRKAICIRGWSESTSIDPSDTSENMAKFLTSLRATLDSSHPEHDSTRLDLSRASTNDAGEDGLTLKLTCDLPGLSPLKWPMHLKKSPPSAIATDLVLPLLETHLTRSREVESLVRIIEHKDVVLTKLLDKLEALGTGLEHVFNPLSGRKKVSRAAAEDKVPGLGIFNRRRWKLDLDDQDDGPNNADSLVAEVFGSEGLQYQDVMKVDESPRLDTWWKEFKGATRNSTHSQAKAATPKQEVEAQPENPMEVEDDDFQVQSTPPRLRTTRDSSDSKQKRASTRPSVKREETPPEPHTSRARRSPEASPKPKDDAKKPPTRLGALGRKKQPPPPRSPSPPPASPKVQPSDHQGEDSETASEDEEDGATASPPADAHNSPPPSPPRQSAPKKTGLGRIGGPKPKASSKPASHTPEPDASGPSSQTSTNPGHKKLGVIGGKKGNGSQTAKQDQEEPRGRIQHTRHSREADPKPEPRETSQERADRKRAELKRELEKKTAAGPAKKKRKF